ncbi:MAG: alpha-amylase family glycosyl hydrolase [Bacteroidales bacterium]|jgi:1,4-alpha-glucan branching enzyme|nr:alpha-amylase family glycosyl hydrolase [Bacteroidales bacterium]
MKSTFTIFILLLSGSLLSLDAQVITVNPAFPTAASSVVVTFNADQGNAGLKDYTGDVYAHTGVITDKSTSPSDWKYVLSPWTVNIPEAKLTRVSANVYTLTISPSIREFYDVPLTDTIKKLAFVFRNENGTKEGKTATGGDIFYDVQKTPVFEVRLIQPGAYSTVVSEGAVLTIEASMSMGDSLVLWNNNERLKKVTTLTATHTLTASGSGLFKITARAYKDLVKKEDSAFYYIQPPVVIADPPADMKAGVNITGDNSALFMLYAPGKNNVFVLGDFNGWVFRDEGYMKKSSDGKWFWAEITGLDPSKEYGFQYVIDGTIRIPDPYTTKVLDPWNDKYITSATYPNLKAYPEGLAEGLVSVFRTRPPQYTWKNNSFTSPSKEDLIIYELHVRDFVAAHDFKTIRDSLAYFTRLGINAIEFMPVNEFDGNSSWGYNPAMYFAVDKYYGTADSFKQLIDSCHSRGIAVIMDIVLNHAYGNNPLVKMYWNNTDNKPSADNPWFNISSPNPTYSWGYDFNHESPATQAFVDSVCHYWISEFKVDGFRFDFTKGFTNTPGEGWGPDPSRINILKRMGNKIWSYKPDAHLILEHFSENSEEANLAASGFLLWGDAKRQYLEAAMGFDSDLSEASYVELGWSQPGLVTYMESHDEERMMYKNVNFGNVAPGGYDVKYFTTALKRTKLAAAFFFTIPGPKMIWQFEELGYDYSIDHNGRLGEKPIKWDYYNVPERRNVYNNFAALADLKKKYEVFSSNDFTLFETGRVKRLNVKHTDMDVVVAGNFDVINGSVNGNFTRDGKWYEFFSGDSVEITSSNRHLLLNLLPGEYRLYTSKRITRPSFLLGVEDTESEEETGRLLFDIYPNPFTDETVIRFTGDDQYQPHTVEIYSSSGSLVRVMMIPAGISETRWDGSGSGGSEVPSGIYYVRVRSGQLSSVRKVILL